MGELTNIAFTAARTSRTTPQLQKAFDYLKSMREGGWTTVRHGDCVGGDAELATLARVLGYHVIAHPPTNGKYRAYVHSDEILSPRDYLVRNRDMVDASTYIIALPDGPERQRSGTWATIRYAWFKNSLGIIIYPNGSIEELLRLKGNGNG